MKRLQLFLLEALEWSFVHGFSTYQYPALPTEKEKEKRIEKESDWDTERRESGEETEEEEEEENRCDTEEEIDENDQQEQQQEPKDQQDQQNNQQQPREVGEGREGGGGGEGSGASLQLDLGNFLYHGRDLECSFSKGDWEIAERDVEYVRSIGFGARGEVYEGRWKGMKCALKGLHPSLANQPCRLAGILILFMNLNPFQSNLIFIFFQNLLKKRIFYQSSITKILCLSMVSSLGLFPSSLLISVLSPFLTLLFSSPRVCMVIELAERGSLAHVISSSSSPLFLSHSLAFRMKMGLDVALGFFLPLFFSSF